MFLLIYFSCPCIRPGSDTSGLPRWGSLGTQHRELRFSLSNCFAIPGSAFPSRTGDSTHWLPAHRGMEPCLYTKPFPDGLHIIFCYGRLLCGALALGGCLFCLAPLPIGFASGFFLRLALFALDKQFCLIQLRVFQRLREVFHTVFPLADTLDCTFPRAEAEVNKFAADHLAFARQVPLVYSLCNLSLLAMYKITL